MTTTPGPWLGKNSKYTEQGLVYSETTGANVAVVYDGEADTALIAAAPELLKALEELLPYAEMELDQSATMHGLNNVDRLAQARVAISRAKGE